MYVSTCQAGSVRAKGIILPCELKHLNSVGQTLLIKVALMLELHVFFVMQHNLETHREILHFVVKSNLHSQIRIFLRILNCKTNT